MELSIRRMNSLRIEFGVVLVLVLIKKDKYWKLRIYIPKEDWKTYVLNHVLLTYIIVQFWGKLEPDKMSNHKWYYNLQNSVNG